MKTTTYKKALLPASLLLLGTLITGCSSLGITLHGSTANDNTVVVQSQAPVKKHKKHKIPKGHLPPPGKCKIWLPNKPAGHQGPSMSCKKAMDQAPYGSWVVKRAKKNKNQILIHEIKALHPIEFHVNFSYTED